MAGQYVVTSDAVQYNNFTQTRQLYASHMSFGAGVAANSTPTIVFATASTQRFAIVAPSIGFIREIKVYFQGKTGGVPGDTIDFRLYNTPWGTLRDEMYDKVYEKKNIVYQSPWDQIFDGDGLPFYNRVGYNDVDPITLLAVTYPRNFLWMEIKPANAVFTVPIVWVTLIFEV